jgi:hypothetical protein
MRSDLPTNGIEQFSCVDDEPRKDEAEVPRGAAAPLQMLTMLCLPHVDLNGNMYCRLLFVLVFGRFAGAQTPMVLTLLLCCAVYMMICSGLSAGI